MYFENQVVKPSSPPMNKCCIVLSGLERQPSTGGEKYCTKLVWLLRLPKILNPNSFCQQFAISKEVPILIMHSLESRRELLRLAKNFTCDISISNGQLLQPWGQT